VFKKEFNASFKLLTIVLGGMVTPLFIYGFFSMVVGGNSFDSYMPYKHYMVSGTVIFQLVYSTFYQASYSTFFSSNVTQTMDELLTSPLNSKDILLGRTLSTSMITVIVSIPLLICLIFWSGLLFNLVWYLIALVGLAVLAIIFSLLGTLLGILVNSEFSLINFANMIVIPLTFVSDTFVKLSAIPSLKYILYCSPIKLANDVVREALVLSKLNWLSGLILVLFMVVSWVVVYKVFDKKLKD
jgi:ABC-2 type transport system permease protein